MTARADESMAAVHPPRTEKGPLVYRQSGWTRTTHWLWAISLFFLLLSGLQIFNAHPALYIGHQSGFEFDNEVLRLGAQSTPEGPAGYTRILGAEIDTTGWFGLSGPSPENYRARGFPAWATLPSRQDLATGRVIHFFFAWLLVFTLAVWAIASLVNGHLRRDVVPGGADLKAIPADIADHARLRFHHTRSYGPLQKLSYAGVLLVMLPLMILTGLCMSPNFNSTVPFLVDLFGGRQTARTIHFVIMVLLVLFFVVHIVMIFAAGPINEMRSMITGWYRTSPETADRKTSDRKMGSN